jgi:nucleoside-diphosphate-sugar epimerase
MGAGDRENVREDDALPPPITHYAASKLAAEAIVSDAHRSGLPSIMLRPRAIFGPGEPTIFPRLIRALARGRLPRLGDGKNRVDLTHIDNAVQAVELAIAAPERALGQAYNISNGEPVLFWDVIARVCDALALPPPKRAVSQRTALWIARSLELGHRLLGLDREPLLTRFGAEMLTRTMTLDITRARRELGYTPRVSMEQGLASFLAHWQAAESSRS